MTWNKTVVRRGCIALVCIIYYLVLAFFDLIFALQHQTYTSQGSGFTSMQSIRQANTLLALHQDAMNVAYIGFIISMVLIIFIHKKVRN